MVQYATQFISLSTMEYQSVWWRLFHAPNSSEWSNVLSLATLLFSLPVSNGKVERTFSQVNLLKSTKRTTLNNDTLNDLLVLNTKFRCKTSPQKLPLTYGGMKRSEGLLVVLENNISLLHRHPLTQSQERAVLLRRGRKWTSFSLMTGMSGCWMCVTKIDSHDLICRYYCMFYDFLLGAHV